MKPTLCISKVLVWITDHAGVTRLVLTNPFDYFRFDDCGGRSDVHRQRTPQGFQFVNHTQTVRVVDEVTNLTFVAVPDENRGTETSIIDRSE
jgi:hypothetical protein